MSTLEGDKRNTVVATPSLPLNVFGKSAACPASQALLDFARSRTSAIRRELIACHLRRCEFCRAELQLLQRFPSAPEQVKFAEIPPSLRALAESMLGKPSTMSFEIGGASRHRN
jgi:hypothetical protein